MKLNLRDLFWLILVCAFAVAWWRERQAVYEHEVAARARQAELQMRIAALEKDVSLYKLLVDPRPPHLEVQ